MAIGFGTACPKPEPRCITKKRAQKVDAKNERACREIVRKRDGNKCRIPGCIERGRTEAHHIVYRSKSKAKRWHPENLITLCPDHHRLRHAGVIQISGTAEDLLVTGDPDALRFRL